MAHKRNLLDVDPTIVERNLMITNPPEDEVQHLFPRKEVPSKLIKPSPGFCIKTKTHDNDKIFINVCQTDALPAPDDISEPQLVEILQSETPSEFRVPMSIGEGRTEPDKSGQPAMVYDIAINTNFFIKIENNKLFKQFFLTVVFEGLQDKYNITINMNDFNILKNRKVMGTLQMHRIQQRDVNRKMGGQEKKLIEELDIPTTPLYTGLKKTAQNMKEPPYRLYRISNDENRQYFVGDFYIPDVTSINDITLDIGEDRLMLESRKRNYLADFFLPQFIEQENIGANFNTNNGMLTITMPIVPS